MALDPNEFDNEKMPLAADHLDDGYDDELAAGLSLTPPPRKKPVLLIALLLFVVVGAGGAYFANEFFSASDMPVPLQKPIDLAPELASPAPAPVDPAQVSPMPVDPATGNPVTDAAATPPIDPLAAPVPDNGAVPTEPAANPVVEANAIPPIDPAAPVAAAEPVAIPESEMAQPNPAPVATAQTDPNIMPVPATEQLQPIDPNAVVANAQPPATEAVTEAASAVPAVPPTAAQKKTADTMAAVNEILGRETTVPSGPPAAAGAMPGAAPAAAQPPVEIVSRAEQVIKVTRSYSAQSPQAMQAAGDRVLANNQYGAALDIYDKQLKQNPSDPLALSGKALALQKEGRTAEAMDAYQRLVELNPRDVDALTNYLGLLQKQKPEEAMTRLNALSEQYPDNAAISGQIASVFAGQMDTPSAMRYFMKAQALDTRNATYPFNIAVLYDRMGNGAKAQTYYREALRLAKENPDQSGSVPLEAIMGRLRSVNR